MHLTGRDFMAFDDQNLPLTRNVGDAFAVICRVLGGHQPNAVARAMSMDRKTARNALDGKAGVPVITKSLQARQKADDDHYELWLALGQMIFGETLDEWEERKLQRIIEGNHHAVSTLEARRLRRQELRALPPADAGGMDRRRA
jgi:hypothetical protein